MAETVSDYQVPLYNVYGERVGTIKLSEALESHGVHLELRARGTGRRRYFTSAKLYARNAQHWEPTNSGGYTVLQLISGVQAA